MVLLMHETSYFSASKMFAPKSHLTKFHLYYRWSVAKLSSISDNNLFHYSSLYFTLYIFMKDMKISHFNQFI